MDLNLHNKSHECFVLNILAFFMSSAHDTIATQHFQFTINVILQSFTHSNSISGCISPLEAYESTKPTGVYTVTLLARDNR